MVSIICGLTFLISHMNDQLFCLIGGCHYVPSCCQFRTSFLDKYNGEFKLIDCIYIYIYIYIEVMLSFSFQFTIEHGEFINYVSQIFGSA